MAVMQWLISRVGVIYIIVFLFCVSCLDLKTLQYRIKVRHLNDAIPDFSDMIIFSQNPDTQNNIDWAPYKNYFELIVRYLPNDTIPRQLLGFVDYYDGEAPQAIELFKKTSVIDGKPVFWSNYNLGVIYYKKKMWALAADYLFKSLVASLKSTVIGMQQSLLYKQISADPHFKYSMGERIKDAQSRACILLLSSLYQMGQYDKIIVLADTALKNKNFSYKDAFFYYEGLGFWGKGGMKEAFMLFEKSLILEKRNPDVYYYMADIFEKAGKLEQARDLLQISSLLHQKNDPRFPYEAHVGLRFF